MKGVIVAKEIQREVADGEETVTEERSRVGNRIRQTNTSNQKETFQHIVVEGK